MEITLLLTNLVFAHHYKPPSLALKSSFDYILVNLLMIENPMQYLSLKSFSSYFTKNSIMCHFGFKSAALNNIDVLLRSNLSLHPTLLFDF